MPVNLLEKSCLMTVEDALNKLSLRTWSEATWHTIPHGLQAIADRSPLGQSIKHQIKAKSWIASLRSMGWTPPSLLTGIEVPK